MKERMDHAMTKLSNINLEKSPSNYSNNKFTSQSPYGKG